MAEIRYLENRYDVIFFCRGWSDLDKILETGAEWHIDCADMVEIETRCGIPIWRTFGRMQWHVIPKPLIKLQGAATWWIYCHDSRATCHIAGCSHLAKSMSWSCHIAGCKNSIHHIKNHFSPYFIFLFLMQFRLWRAAAFVSYPIHLFVIRKWYIKHNKYGSIRPTLLSIYYYIINRNRCKADSVGVMDVSGRRRYVGNISDRLLTYQQQATRQHCWSSSVCEKVNFSGFSFSLFSH